MTSKWVSYMRIDFPAPAEDPALENRNQRSQAYAMTEKTLRHRSIDPTDELLRRKKPFSGLIRPGILQCMVISSEIIGRQPLKDLGASSAPRIIKKNSCILTRKSERCERASHATLRPSAISELPLYHSILANNLA